MARRETQVTIQRAGRDQGKIFTLRELPVAQADEWFVRAFMLLVRAGVDVPPDIFQYGAMGFATIGLGAALTGLGKAPFHEVKALWNEMLPCIVALQSPDAMAPITNHQQILTQIEEVLTLMQLREEVLSLHLGFSLRERLSEYRQKALSIMMTGTGPTIATSAEASPSLSEAA